MSAPLEGSGVPLSPDEQRILQEIEKTLSEQDPQFANQVRSTTIYRVAGRNLKWLALGFVAGLAMLLWGFTKSLLFGVLGFGIMLVCAFFFERNLRRMGKAGLQSISASVRGSGINGAVGRVSRRMRDRFRRRE